MAENKKMFQTIDGETLFNQMLEPTPFIVSSLISAGLHILGGAPKIGKSWLMLWLCLKVAKGENLWNYQTKRGTTLYLCLEDSFERIQSRLLDIADDAPANIHFAVMAEDLNSGLPEQIENFLAQHLDTNLIVIDTLQNIRSEYNNSNPYANDYRELSVLRDLANRHRIAILCVHHLRKMKDVDPMNMLSGTTGLSGAVDTVFILDCESRTKNRATLFCTGRDIESAELKLELDPETHIWKLCSEEAEKEIKLTDDIIETVHDFLVKSSSDFSGTATELSEAIADATSQSIYPATLRKKLIQHHAQLAEYGYRCAFRRTHDEKIIDITKTASDAFGASAE